MFKIITTSGREFLQNKGQTLLEAAINSGIFFPYSCKTGRCSTCKCKVLNGQGTTKLDALGLTAEDIKQGFTLSCVMRISSKSKRNQDLKLCKFSIFT